MDWLAHPIVVATYVAFLGLLITAIKRGTQLFGRVGKVEDGVERLEEKVDELGRDLRAHMADEGKNLLHLENLIKHMHDKE